MLWGCFQRKAAEVPQRAALTDSSLLPRTEDPLCGFHVLPKERQVAHSSNSSGSFLDETPSF